jgi:hypothetical protein
MAMATLRCIPQATHQEGSDAQPQLAHQWPGEALHHHNLVGEIAAPENSAAQHGLYLLLGMSSEPKR